MVGPPASGKGTQGRLLAENLGIAYLSTGARLRREIEEGTLLGQKAKVFLDANQYIPDSLAIEMVGSWIGGYSSGWLLDGFPRSIPQAEYLCGTEAAPKLPTIIHLTVPVLELRKRVITRRECLSCGSSSTSEHHSCPQCGSTELVARVDDSAEGFEKRLQAYESLTIPSLQLLRTRTEVLTIEGTGTREEIAQKIRTQLS